MPSKNENKTTVILCECGTHMLKVQSEIDYYDDTVTNNIRFHQDIYLAMFNYGDQKLNFFDRCIIAWKYLRSGNMYSDQLCLNYEEAKKLASFLNENLIEPEE